MTAAEILADRIAARHLVAERLDERPPCKWTLTRDVYESVWETDCGQSFYIEEGTPEGNHFKFCCYCGGVLKQVIIDMEVDEDELDTA